MGWLIVDEAGEVLAKRCSGRVPSPGEAVRIWDKEQEGGVDCRVVRIHTELFHADPILGAHEQRVVTIVVVSPACSDSSHT